MDADERGPRHLTPREYTPAELAAIEKQRRLLEETEVVLLYMDLAAWDRGERW